MYVCICNALTERLIAQAVEDGAASVAQVYAALDSAPLCGKCLPMVRGMVRAALTDPDEQPPMATR